MKKIAILFTILCASALNGMENPQYGSYKGLGNLSPEIQVMIIQALNTYKNPVDVINAIKAISLVDKELNEIINQEYGNQKGFTKLVHILADKFNETTGEIADKFKTPAANEYIKLGSQLVNTIMDSDKSEGEKTKNEVIALIKDGADVNFSRKWYFGDEEFGKDWFIETPLGNAIVFKENIELTKLLIQSGANPEKLNPFQKNKMAKLLQQ